MRWIGGEGGWENPFPTPNISDELINIHLEYALASKCELAVVGDSGYADRAYNHMCCQFPPSQRGTRPHRCLCPPKIDLRQYEDYNCQKGNKVMCWKDNIKIRDINHNNTESYQFSLSPEAFVNSADTIVRVSTSIEMQFDVYKLSETENDDTKKKIDGLIENILKEQCVDIEDGPPKRSYC
jgi:hypothetical protein